MRYVTETLDGCETTFGLCDRCNRACQTQHMYATRDNLAVCITCK